MGWPVAGVVSLPVLLLLLPPRQGEACAPWECCFGVQPHPEEDAGSAWGSAPGPQNLSCYRRPNAQYECSWGYEGPRTGVRHFLHCCFGPGRCCYFAVGAATSVQFSDQDKVPVRRAVSFWVESQGPGGTRQSPRVNVTLSRWVKYDPPLGKVRVSRRRGHLLMEWAAPEDQEDALVQFRQRPAGGAWELGDCAWQDGAGPRDVAHESCLCPLEAGAVREFQFRRRRGQRDPGGPWSSWSSSVCSPLEPPALTWLNMSLTPLDPDGRRQLTLEGQLPQPVLPEGCREEVTYQVHLHMLSCPCKAKATAIRTLHLGRNISISGAAYSLMVSPEGAGSPNRSWHISAPAHTGATALDISTGAAGVSLRWPSRGSDFSYCVEWEPQSPDGGGASCTLVSAREGNHSWARVPGALAPGGCVRVTILASARPEKLFAWSTVLSTFHLVGNASAAGAPQLVSVRDVTASSASVTWTPPPLGACRELLRGYVVRYQDEAGAAESQVGPAQTSAGLLGLRSGRAYTVQVRADLPQGPDTWSRPLHFHTDDQLSVLSTFLASMGSFLAVFLVGVLGYLGLSRASRCLCPPLPGPCASSAVQLPDGQWKQAWFWVSPSDFLEEASLQEALAVNTAWEQGEGTGPDTPRGLNQELESPRGAPEPTQDTELPAEAGAQGPRPGNAGDQLPGGQAAAEGVGLPLHLIPPRPSLEPDSPGHRGWPV